MHITSRVASVQVIPVIREPDGVTPQFDGPTERTTHWAVYLRNGHGLTTWVADRTKEEHAMKVGKWYADKHGVSIENQPWKKPDDIQT